MERNKQIFVNDKDVIICIKEHSPYKVGNKYKLKEIDDEYVTVYSNYKRVMYTHFPKIKNLHKFLKEYDDSEDEVKNTLTSRYNLGGSSFMSDVVDKIYFEDIFTTLREQRKKKLEKLR